MGLLGALFGRRKPSPVSWADSLGAMGAITQRLEQEFDTFTTGQAALIVQPDSSSPEGIVPQIESALSGHDSLMAVHRRVQPDNEGHAWVVVDSERLAGLADAVLRTAEALQERGLGERLLAAVFPFTWQERRLYWICHLTSGRYTPFVAMANNDERLRDYPVEVRMEAALQGELPTERDTSRWYPIWGMPI